MQEHQTQLLRVSIIARQYANGIESVHWYRFQAAKSTKKAKQTKLDSMFKNAAEGDTASPVEDSAMIGGPDIFMDQLESMQDMQYDYNFDDPGMLRFDKHVACRSLNNTLLHF